MAESSTHRNARKERQRRNAVTSGGEKDTKGEIHPYLSSAQLHEGSCMSESSDTSFEKAVAELLRLELQEVSSQRSRNTRIARSRDEVELVLKINPESLGNLPRKARNMFSILFYDRGT